MNMAMLGPLRRATTRFCLLGSVLVLASCTYGGIGIGYGGYYGGYSPYTSSIYWNDYYYRSRPSYPTGPRPPSGVKPMNPIERPGASRPPSSVKPMNPIYRPGASVRPPWISQPIYRPPRVGGGGRGGGGGPKPERY